MTDVRECAPFTYTLDCRACGREFESERKSQPFCPRCEARTDAQHRADVGPRITGYTVERNRIGANREAMKILRGEK